LDFVGGGIFGSRGGRLYTTRLLAMVIGKEEKSTMLIL